MGVNHELINNIGTKPKCRHLKKLTVKGLCGRCLSEFIDWRYCQSCWYFRPSFVNWCPSNLLSGSTLSPLPPSPVSKYSIYRQCVAEMGWGVLIPVGFCRSFTLYLTRFIIYKIARPPQTKPRSGGGLWHINTCAKSLYRSFFVWRHFALVSILIHSPWGGWFGQ